MFSKSTFRGECEANEAFAIPSPSFSQFLTGISFNLHFSLYFFCVIDIHPCARLKPAKYLAKEKLFLRYCSAEVDLEKLYDGTCCLISDKSKTKYKISSHQSTLERLTSTWLPRNTVTFDINWRLLNIARERRKGKKWMSKRYKYWLHFGFHVAA